MAQGPLEDVLRKTGFRASLAPEYLQGRAPSNQHQAGHQLPDRPTYFGLPAIKKPTWIWSVPVYFFVGGMASGSYIIATIADILGRREDRPLVRAGRYLSLLGMLLSPLLLIADLGRPERWYNMLRVFKPRSMMNIGAWAMTTFGLFTGVAAAAQLLQDLSSRSLLARVLAPPLRALSWTGIVPAAFVGGYTGLLLAATNVPLWAANRLLLGPMFLSAALSTGAAAVQLASHLFGRVGWGREERLMAVESIALGTELALTAASWARLGDLARPLTTGSLGRAYKLGSVGMGMLLPLALNRLGGRYPLVRLLSPALVLAGGLLLRFTITEAGKQSADDPHAYFEYTRPTS